MKHPASCMDSVFDIDPEPGRPLVVSQPGPPAQESLDPPLGPDGSGSPSLTA